MPRQAPTRWPDRSASTSAAWSTTRPRDVLTRSHSGFMRASAAASSRAHLPRVHGRPADLGEARRVFRELAARGLLHHRQVKIPDPLIAAVAARNGLTVVHYDSDS